MKKIHLLIFILAVSLIGCSSSISEEEYLNKSTDFASEVYKIASQVPKDIKSITEQSSISGKLSVLQKVEKKTEKLNEELETLISDFTKIKPPRKLKNIHNLSIKFAKEYSQGLKNILNFYKKGEEAYATQWAEHNEIGYKYYLEYFIEFAKYSKS